MSQINDGASPERPWLGLSAYTEATQSYFFGREREIDELQGRIRSHALTVLFGLSGRGKTSLLGAGLLPRLRGAGARPVLLRLRQDGEPFIEQLRQAWDQAVGFDPSGASLWERGYRRVDRSALLAAPPVLVLDQFEEVFTLGQTRTAELEALFREMACLVENRVPHALRERLAEDENFAEQFDEQPSPVRLVITLREDYLAQLEGWKGVLPALMRNRMALLPLNGPQALEAVLRPGRLGPVPLVDEATAAGIVRFVAQRGEDTPLEEIEAVPPLLSLLCFELNEARLDAGAERITPDQLEAQKSNILQNFYSRCFDGLSEVVRDVVESPLVVSESGHRNACAEDDVLLSLMDEGLPRPEAEAALARLVNSRLLTQERMAGARRIELTHDLLTPLVVRSRNERRARRRLQAAEAERAEIETRNIRLQKERRRWQWAAVAMGLLALSAIVAGGLAWRAERRVSKTLNIAQTTVDEVLTTLESPETDEIHGFFRIGNRLLDKLVPLERDLEKIQGTDDSPEGVLRKVKLAVRQAGRLQFDGHQQEAAPLYRSAYDLIAALPTNRITPELRDYQFQCLYRLDGMNWLFKPGEYDQKQWIEKGIALFETSRTYVQGSFWREVFAQRIAQYLRSQQQAEQALIYLNRSLDDLRAAAAEKPNIWAIESENVLWSEIESTQKTLNRLEEARKTHAAKVTALVEKLLKHPRSKTLALHRLFDLFDQLDAAYWAKDADAYNRWSSEINDIISRFTGSQANTFEAAAAQFLVKQSEFAIYVKDDAEAAAPLARDALAAYGKIYSGQVAELPNFDASSEAMANLTAAMAKLESKTPEAERESLQKKHVQELLALSVPFLECAAKLGVRSNCQGIIENATENAKDRLKGDPDTLVQTLPPRIPLLPTAAQAMLERDQRQPPSVPNTDRESTEPLYRYCSTEVAYSKALLKLDRATEALPVLTKAITFCEPWANQYDFDLYLRDSFSGLLNNLAQAQRAVGDMIQARATLARCTEYEFFQCYKPYSEMLDNGSGGPKDADKAAELRSRKLNMKRLTIQIRKKGGSELTVPFDVYIRELSDKRHYKGIEDQAIWLERNRGMIVPQDVRDSFIKLEDIARENHVSFPELVAYALSSAEKDGKDKKKPDQQAPTQKQK
ncbi:protein of unknown function [Methylomagnum ishizawai]|uniref:Novel STAND NTPase 1 domain-containing protein n=1 Tax=Methylomagnum ishizawai TaxID=1760988 RepID=A0A1Y6D0A9_9GAMM|nr:DUF2610 domain-containing protein [Methylomagnum ishizawai]SMF96368.1 protein of unknown function [Methylomagnum ishizawai]